MLTGSANRGEYIPVRPKVAWTQLYVICILTNFAVRKQEYVCLSVFLLRYTIKVR